MKINRYLLSLVFILCSNCFAATNKILFLGTIDRLTYARDVDLPGGDENLSNMIRCGEEIVTFHVNSTIFGNINGNNVVVKSFLSEFCHSTTDFNLQEEGYLVLAFETEGGYFVESSAPVVERVTATIDDFVVKAYAADGNILKFIEKLKIQNRIKENVVCEAADLISDKKSDKSKKILQESEILEIKKKCSGVLVNEIKIQGQL